MRKIYFGGGFNVQANVDLVQAMKDDYRVHLLGDVSLLIYSPEDSSKEIQITDCLTYVGPYYYYDGQLNASYVVAVEKEMIDKCSDAVFLLEASDSPGSVTELVYAALLGKDIHIYYVSNGRNDPESGIDSDLWYPIAFSERVNGKVKSVRCDSREDAVSRIFSFAESIK